MRYCKKFFCGQVADRVCCASCPWRRDCSDPCLNHPSRCGLEHVSRRDGPDAVKKEVSDDEDGRT